MKVISTAVAILVIGLATYAILGSSPTAPDTEKYEDLVSQALFEAQFNERSATGAPQQSVVNGWVARDLLVIQSAQLNESLKAQARTTELLWIALLLGGIAYVSTAVSRRDGREPDPGPKSAGYIPRWDPPAVAATSAAGVAPPGQLAPPSPHGNSPTS